MLIPRGGNDLVMTPKYVAERVVKWANPSGLVLEPCSGTGLSFLLFAGLAFCLLR